MRRRRSVIARIGAEPVPVQIMSRLEPGWFGMRKLVAERADDFDGVALGEIAQVVRRDARDRVARRDPR